MTLDAAAVVHLQAYYPHLQLSLSLIRSTKNKGRLIWRWYSNTIIDYATIHHINYLADSYIAVYTIPEL